MARRRNSDSDSYTEDGPAKKKSKVQKANAASNTSQASAPAKAQKTSKTARPRHEIPVLHLDSDPDEASDQDDIAPATSGQASKVEGISSNDNYGLPPLSAGPYPFPQMPPAPPEFLPTIRGFQFSGNPRDQPVGFSNPKGTNRCYQNAILAVILHSKRFLAYIQGWHMPREHALTLAEINKKDTKVPKRVIKKGTQGDAAKDTKKDKEEDDIEDTEPISSLMLSSLDRLATALHDGNRSQKQVQLEADNFRRDITFRRAFRRDLMVADWMSYSRTEAQNQQCDATEFLNWILQMTAAQLELPQSAFEIPWNHLGMIRLTQRNCCSHCEWPLKVRRGRIEPYAALNLIPPGIMHMDNSSPEFVNALKSRQTVNMDTMMSNSLCYSRDPSYACPRCGQNDAAHPLMNKAMLQTAPEILFMSISRTAVTINKGGDFVPTKWFGQVPIPEEIDIAPWLEPHEFGAGTSIKYKLVSCVAHKGRALDEGHYISYVRGITDHDQWYELNDMKVKPVDFESFCDGTPYSSQKSGFANRLTPFLMVYEKDYKTETLVAGREPMNPTVASPSDVKPKYWIEDYNADHPNEQIQWAKVKKADDQNLTPSSKPDGKKATASDKAGVVQETEEMPDSTATSQQKTPPKSDQEDHEKAGSATESQQEQGNQASNGKKTEVGDSDKPAPTKSAGATGFTLQGPSDDQGKGPAQLDIRITFGGFAVDLPPFTISQFDMNTERDVKVDAWITVPDPQPKGTTKGSATADDNALVLDITDIMVDKAKGRKGPRWTSRWKSSGAVTKQEPVKKTKTKTKTKAEPAKKKAVAAKKVAPKPKKMEPTKKNAQPKKTQPAASRKQPGRNTRSGN